MKELKSSFGFSTVVAGQRQGGNILPQLIAVSTKGGFRITGAATRLLGIMPGDNIAFINNIPNIDAAIADVNSPMHASLVEFCEEKGLDVTTPEASQAIHKEFDMWMVYKGIQEFDSKGNAKTCRERWSKSDKTAYATAHFDELMAQVMGMDASGNTDEAKRIAEVQAALSRKDATTEEKIEVLAQVVQGPEVDSYTGSKTANPAGQTGSGLSLNFCDNNVWATLKSDLVAAEKADVTNRVFTLDDEIQTIVISDGHKEVEVKAMALCGYKDEAPARVGKGATSAEECATSTEECDVNVEEVTFAE